MKKGSSLNIPDKSNQHFKIRFHRNEFRTGNICVPFALFCFAILPPACQAQPAQLGTAQLGQTDKTIQQSAESALEIADLIARLGDEDHLIRSESEASLLKIGQPAIAPLQAVLNFEDPAIAADNEIRLRATRLVILIQREVRKRNLAQFLDGQRDDVDLDGWSQFRQIVGNQATARRLFIKLHRSRANLLQAPKLGELETENELHKTIISQIRLSIAGNAESVTGSLGAVLFAASLKTKWDPDKPARAPLVSISDTKRIQNVLVQPHMVSTLKSHFAKSEFKKLISTWLDSLPFQSDNSNSTKNVAAAIEVIDAYQLHNKSELTLSFAINRELPTNVRSAAIEVLSRIADAKISSKLLPLVGDETVVGNYLLSRSITKLDKTVEIASTQPQTQLMEVQIRDLALATSIILNGSSLEDFGFYPQAFQHNELVINQAGFFSPDERTKAFSKWEKHKSENNSVKNGNQKNGNQKDTAK